MTTKWKQLLAWALTLCLTLSLCACGGEDSNNASDPAQGNHVTEAHDQNKPTEESVKAPLEPVDPDREYPKNFLLNKDNYGIAMYLPGYFGLNAWDIRTITFVNTLSDAPETAKDCSENADGSVMAWVENECDLYIAGEGGVTARSCNSLFAGFENMTKTSFNNCFYTDPATDMTNMFANCSKLQTLDLSFFNMSNVTNIKGMFDSCFELKSIELSNWDTSRIENFSSAFFVCRNLKSLDVSRWDTSSAKNISRMFEWCEVLSDIDLSGWNTSQVINMSRVFDDCANLEKLDLSGWDVSNVKDIHGMFSDCISLTKLDLSTWDLSNAQDMSLMFCQCQKLTDIGCTLVIPEGCDTTDMYIASGLE